MNDCMFADKIDCGVENCAVRLVTLLMKNVARVDEGGQIREENVLKSMQVLGELLILS